MAWKPSATYARIADANRQYYAKTAHLYQTTETCITDAWHQQMLEADLDSIINLSGKPAAALRVLDACGGSGNVSLKFLRRGISVTLCDISSDLISLFEVECAKRGYTAVTVCQEIADFLQHTQENYDLIVFSSALHHLENIESVLELALLRLAPGGLLYTVFDPTYRGSLSMFARVVLSLDYYLFKIADQTSDLPAAISRRIRRSLKATKHDSDIINDAELGVLAEYYARIGIDDMRLVEWAKTTGVEVVWHVRYTLARYAWSRWLLQILHTPTSFKLLLKKDKLGK